MSTNPLAVPDSQPTSQHETGALGRMTGMIVNPPCTFVEIARRPTWVTPFIALCVLRIIVSGLPAQKTDWRSFFERQMSKNSPFDQMPQDQKDNLLEKQVQYGTQGRLRLWRDLHTDFCSADDPGVLGRVQSFYRRCADLQERFWHRFARVRSPDHQQPSGNHHPAH
jgi:hypothetical protein